MRKKEIVNRKEHKLRETRQPPQVQGGDCGIEKEKLIVAIH